MAGKKSPLPMAGNTQELERLQGEIDHLNEVQDKILIQKRDLEEKVRETTIEIGNLKKSNQASYDKLKEYEQTKEQLGAEEAATEGYVKIATLNFNGKFPSRSRIKLKDNWLIVPREIKEGVCYEEIPVKMALSQLTDGSAFKRALIGPCEKIEGDVATMTAGTDEEKHPKSKIPYPKHFVFCRHTVGKTGSGTPYLAKVEVVESVDKSE